MNAITRLECPHCAQPLELTEEDAARGLNCPSCFKFISGLPQFKQQAAPTTSTTPTRSDNTWRIAEIKSQAWNFQLASFIAFGIGVIILLVALYKTLNDDGRSGYYIAAGSFIGMALWLYLIAQIIHIRANTEK